MNIPPKYEDVVDKLDAALAREAALREDLEESDAVVTKLSTLLAGVAIALRGPELELHRHGYNGLPELISALQQRLTVAEQRAGELLIMLRMAWGSYHVSAEDCRRIDVALKPAAEGEGS